MSFFSTPRLKFVKISRSDLDFLHSINANHLVDEFNTRGIPSSITKTEKYLNSLLTAQQEKLQCKYCWIIHRKDNKQNIGICGFTLSNDRFNRGEIYYSLDSQSWGNGFVSKAAKALVRRGFEQKALHRIEAGMALTLKDLLNGIVLVKKWNGVNVSKINREQLFSFCLEKTRLRMPLFLVKKLTM